THSIKWARKTYGNLPANSQEQSIGMYLIIVEKKTRPIAGTYQSICFAHLFLVCWVYGMSVADHLEINVTLYARNAPLYNIFIFILCIAHEILFNFKWLSTHIVKIHGAALNITKTTLATSGFVLYVPSNDESSAKIQNYIRSGGQTLDRKKGQHCLYYSFIGLLTQSILCNGPTGAKEHIRFVRTREREIQNKMMEKKRDIGAIRRPACELIFFAGMYCIPCLKPDRSRDITPVVLEIILEYSV
ncbi:hypothetical protein ACJX0J_026984, partial [Zea mays]